MGEPILQFAIHYTLKQEEKPYRKNNLILFIDNRRHNFVGNLLGRI